MYPKSVIAMLILVLITLSACGNDDDAASVQGASGNQSSSASNETSMSDDPQSSQSTTNTRVTSIINPTNAAQLVDQHSTGKAAYNDFYWSPDGQTLALLTTTDVRLYNMDNLGTPTHRFDQFSAYVEFSPDGERAISRTVNNETVVWNVDTGDIELTLESGPFLSLASFSPDGQAIVTLRDNALHFWDAADGSRLDSIPLEMDGVLSFFYRDDGALLTIIQTDAGIEVWDVAEKSMVFDVPLNGDVPPFGIQVSEDGRVIAIPIPSGFAEQQAMFILTGLDFRDTHTGEQLNSINNPNLRLSHDGTSYVTFEFQIGLVMRDVATNQEIFQFVEEPSDSPQFFSYFNQKFSPDGTMLAVMDSTARVVIFDMETGERIGQLADSGSRITTIDLHADGRTLMIGSTNAGFTFWDITSGAIIGAEPIGTSSGAFFMTDGEQIVGMGDDVSLYHADTLQRSKLIMATSGRSPALSPDRVLISMIDSDFQPNAMVPDQYLRVWNLELDRMAMPEVSLSSEPNVQQQLFSPDNHTLAVGFDNSTIRVFDVSVANEQAALRLNDGRRGDIAFAFHPDGDSLMIAITSDDATDGKTELYHWDLESPQTDLITTLNASYISAMSFNPDGTLLVLGGSFENGGIALFDPTTQEIVAEIGSQRQIARELRFSPDGGVLFSIGNDNFVRVWGFAE